ncbi:hypothetical protein [Staphylococcus epidermidis]|uniref:hypothetical protein n=1 Tax=Staphylococcus epidermidis TaxID=1282 RepID=UPI00119FF7C6|nr:hypothetical protein [Staphylococcus epidermidis]
MVGGGADEGGMEGLDELLRGGRGMGSCSEDVVGGAKVIGGFGKEDEGLEVKRGVMEGKVMCGEEVKRVG